MMLRITTVILDVRYTSAKSEVLLVVDTASECATVVYLSMLVHITETVKNIIKA